MTSTIRRALAVDVGGSFLKAGIVGSDGRSERTVSVPTGSGDGPEAVFSRVVETLEPLRREAEHASAEVSAIGAAVPGIVDEPSGVVRFCANLPWRDFPFAANLAEAVGLPVVLRHDVRAAALAEGRVGAARGVADFVLVALGTGIFAALALGGRVRPGAHGRSGEIGHVVVEPEGLACGCGGRGCLETVASASAIARRYADRVGARAPGAVGPAREGVDAAGVLARAGGGDPAARAVRDEAVGALALALALGQGLVDVEVVVLGGGLARAGDALVGPLSAALGRRSGIVVAPTVALSSLGVDAGMIGAGLAAIESTAAV